MVHSLSGVTDWDSFRTKDTVTAKTTGKRDSKEIEVNRHSSNRFGSLWKCSSWYSTTFLNPTFTGMGTLQSLRWYQSRKRGVRYQRNWTVESITLFVLTRNIVLLAVSPLTEITATSYDWDSSPSHTAHFFWRFWNKQQPERLKTPSSPWIIFQ